MPEHIVALGIKISAITQISSFTVMLETVLLARLGVT